MQKYGLKDLWDYYYRTNTYLSEFQEKKKKAELENILKEIKVENFPKLAKDIHLGIQETANLNTIFPKKFIPRHCCKLLKMKRKEKF